MTEPVLSYASTNDKPRITRDRTAVILTVVAVLALIPMFCGEWIQGRSNCRLGGIFGFGCEFVPIYLVTAIWLLVRVIMKMHRGSMPQRIRWITMLLVVWLPMVDFFLSRSIGRAVYGPAPGFPAGFASWVNANVDVQAIRQWGAAVPLDPAKATDESGIWPDGSLVFPIPKAEWPSNLASLELEEMYILADRTAIILRWGVHGTWNYSRTVVIRAPDASPIAQPLYPETSRVAQKGVWVYISYPG